MQARRQGDNYKIRLRMRRRVMPCNNYLYIVGNWKGYARCQLTRDRPMRLGLGHGRTCIGKYLSVSVFVNITLRMRMYGRWKIYGRPSLKSKRLRLNGDPSNNTRRATNGSEREGRWRTRTRKKIRISVNGYTVLTEERVTGRGGNEAHTHIIQRTLSSLMNGITFSTYYTVNSS